MDVFPAWMIQKDVKHMNKENNHYKQFTLIDRVNLQKGLDENSSLRSIGKVVDKSASSVLREVNRHKLVVGPNSQRPTPCIHKQDCSLTGVCGQKGCHSLCRYCIDCESRCEFYAPGSCSRLEKSPYVCNGCGKKDNCSYDRVLYIATHAHDIAKETLSASREGINQDPETLEKMNELVSPLLKKGQPVAHIYASHDDDICCARSTFYNYVHNNLFDASDTDLRRKVRYRTRKRSTRRSPSAAEKLAMIDRDYEAFQEYLKIHPDTSVVEMDTVVGPVHSKKVMLTLLFRSCSLMLIFLLPQKTQGSVIETLNWLSETLGIECFQKLFPVILADRGVEFLNAEAIECDQWGEIKTKLFYCDPYCSWQKGKLEKNHEYIRFVIPKGTTFDSCTQDDITLLANHINSTARDSLNGSTPYRLSRILLDNKLHSVVGLEEVLPDDVYLRPGLIWKK